MKMMQLIIVKTLAVMFLPFILTTLVRGQQLDYLSKAPFYKNYKKHSLQNVRSAYLQVAIDEKVFEEFFYKGREKALQPLVDVMNNYLDSLDLSAALSADSFPKKGNPYVFVGSSEAETAPPGSEMMRELHHKFPPMIIYIQEALQRMESANPGNPGAKQCRIFTGSVGWLRRISQSQ